MFSYAYKRYYLAGTFRKLLDQNGYQSCAMDSHFEEAYDASPTPTPPPPSSLIGLLEKLSVVEDNMVLPFLFTN